MEKSRVFILALIVALVCLVALSEFRGEVTGLGAYDKDDSLLEGINVAGKAKWEDYPDHREGHGVDELTDGSSNYWWCSSDYNCSITGFFEEPEFVNEIHIHMCSFQGKSYEPAEQYIARDFEVLLKEEDRYAPLQKIINNTEQVDFKFTIDDPKKVSSVKIDGLKGKGLYQVGDYDFPCISEVEVFKVRPVREKAEPAQEVPEEQEQASLLGKLLSWLGISSGAA